MKEHYFQCVNCQKEFAPSMFTIRCDTCNDVLSIVYREVSALGPLLPVDIHEINSLGSGNTPVISLKTIADELGVAALVAKLEMLTVTGSFKDRGSTLLMTMAKMFGITEFVEDSSGNAGASLAAYAAAARIRGHIFSPSSASKGKLDQIKIFGAELHKTEGSRQASTEAAEAYVRERNLPYLSHSLNPYFSEGMKIVSYELIKQLDIPIHHVVLPVGNGSLCIGMFRGFNEIKSFNKQTIIPRFHVVQSRNVMPIVNYVNGNKPSKIKKTVASGIAVANPPRLMEIAAVVEISNGSAVAVCDNSILNWQEKLANTEGIFCEPTSATVFSGLEILLEQGTILKDENVLIPITGTGLKEPL